MWFVEQNKTQCQRCSNDNFIENKNKIQLFFNIIGTLNGYQYTHCNTNYKQNNKT